MRGATLQQEGDGVDVPAAIIMFLFASLFLMLILAAL